MREQAQPRSPNMTKYAVLRMTLWGANPRPRITGLEPLAGRSDYFIGRDPARWRTDIPTYARVKYVDVYPRTDIIFHSSSQQQLEYDFMVEPGGNPATIGLVFAGEKKLSLNSDGNLVIQTAAGELVQYAPQIYQVVEGVRRKVRGGYVLRGKHEIGFQVGSYDRTRQLVIDPSLVYSTFLGGVNNDEVNAIAVDSSGSAYVVGDTASPNFPVTPGSFQTTNPSSFVAKVNPAGTALIYSTFLGANANDVALSVAVDGGGNAYICGETGSGNFPVTTGAFQTKPAGSSDAFVTKLNPSGSALVYSTYLGGANLEDCRGIAVDAAGDAYVTGITESNNFPTTLNSVQPAYGGGFSDGYVAKLDQTGSHLVYATYLGGNGLDRGNGIAVDSLGNAEITGATQSQNFPTTAGAFQTTSGGSLDVFLTKINPNGTAFVYSTYLGGAFDDDGLAIALDSAGNTYVAGGTESSNFPTTPGVLQTAIASAGNGVREDAFVAKFNASGSLIYSTYLGGTDNDQANSIAIDASGDAFVVGRTMSTDFPQVGASFQSGFGAGPIDAFVSRLNPAASSLLYSTYLGAGDSAASVALDSAGNAYVGGGTGPNFPVTVCSVQTVYGGGNASDGFVTKLQSAGPPSTIPFSNINATLELGQNQFQLTSSFSLGCGSTGIAPLTEAVTLQVGSFTAAIPPGSLTQSGQGSFVFQGPVNDATLQVKLSSNGGASYALQVQAGGANLKGTTSPVTITVTIGNNTGSTTVVPS